MTALEEEKEREVDERKKKKMVEASKEQTTAPALSPTPTAGSGPADTAVAAPIAGAASPAPQAGTKETVPSAPAAEGGKQALPVQRAAEKPAPAATTPTSPAATTSTPKATPEKAVPAAGGFGRLVRGSRQEGDVGSPMQQMHAVRAYYLSPENKLDAAMEKEFKGRMTQSGTQGDSRVALRATINSAFLKLRYPQLFNGTPVMREALMKRHATMRWNIRTAMDETSFFERVKADYELDNLLITAADFAVARGVDLTQAKDGALQKMMTHPGWNAKLLSEYEARFDAAAAHAQKLARTGRSRAVHQVMPGKSPRHLFAKTPPPEMGVNGNIIVPGGHYLQEHTLATRLLKGYEIVDRNASLPEMMKVAGNEGLYFKSSSSEATQDGQGTTTAKQEPSWWDSATAFVRSLTRGPGIQPSLNPDSEGYRQLEAYTRLQLQRDKDERQMLDDAQALSRERAALVASTEHRRKQIEKEYAGDEQGRLLRGLDLEYGKQNLALAKRRSEVFWKSAELMGDGKVSVQTYEQTGKLLDEKSLASTYRGTPQLSRRWEDAATQVARLSGQPGMQDIVERLAKLDGDYGTTMRGLEKRMRLGEESATAEAAKSLKGYLSARGAILQEVAAKKGEIWKEASKLHHSIRTNDSLTEEEKEMGFTDDPPPSDPDEFARYVKFLQELRESHINRTAKELGLSRAEMDVAISDVDASTREWGEGSSENEKARVLSDGTVEVNPNLWFDAKGYEAAVRASNAPAEAKREALRKLPTRKQWAVQMLYKQLSGHEGFEEQLSNYGGSMEDAVVEFVKDANKSPHWTQITNRVLGGFMGLLTSGAGVVAGVSGNDDAHTAMEIFSDKQQAYEVKASLARTNGVTRAVSKVGGAVPSLIPALGAGRLAGGLATLAGMTPQAAQSIALLVSSAMAGGQSFGSVYNEAHEAYVDAGMAEQEARRAALKPAIIGGLITAAMTQAGGANGVEAIFRSAGARELIKRTLWERAKMLGLNATEEAIEEGTDQLLQGIVARYNHRRGLTNEQILDEAVEAAWIGGLLGGTVSGVQEGSQALWGKDGELNEAVMRPPEEVVMGDVVMPSSEEGSGGAEEGPITEEQVHSQLTRGRDELTVTASRSKATTDRYLGELHPEFMRSVDNDAREGYPGIAELVPAPGLSREERIVEARFAQLIAENPSEMVKRYRELALKDFGTDRYVNADLALSLLPEYAADKEFRTVFHRATYAPVSYLTRKLVMPEILGSNKNGRSLALFLAGGPASGKSTASKEALRETIENSAIIIDSNLATVSRATEFFQAAMDAELRPVVAFVYTPWQRVEQLVLHRLKGQGRPIAAETLAGNHYDAQQTFFKLASLYDGRADFVVLANEGGIKDITQKPIEFLKDRTYDSQGQHGSKEHLINRFRERVIREWLSGNLTTIEAIASGYSRIDSEGFGRLEEASRGLRERTRKADASSGSSLGRQ